MKYKDMTPERAAALKKYLRERHNRLYVPAPKRETKSPYKFKDYDNEHRHIAEAVLGKSLHPDTEIHHVDGNGKNNAHSNIVICPNHAYHMLLHRRQRALNECGNANWLPCAFCRQHDEPKNMSLYIPKDQTSPRAVHLRCQAEYEKQRRTRKEALA
jgi:hypothetical protein